MLDGTVDAHADTKGGVGDAGDAGDADGAPHPLLEIQRLDTEAEQLHHRRQNLARQSGLSAAHAERDERQRALEAADAARLEVLIRQKRLEQEAAVIEARADTDDTRLYSGEVRGIRDLQALQEEVAGLRSRQGHLEEQAIEALLEAEELERSAAGLRDGLERSRERVTVLEAEVAVTVAEIDGRLDEVQQARSRQAAQLEAAALSSYERLRGSFGPSTAVEFDPSSGCGCPSQMPAAEVARIKRCPPGSVEGCSECGRLVIR